LAFAPTIDLYEINMSDINSNDAEEMTSGLTPEGLNLADIARLMDKGCDYFWAKRGGDPHRKIFNNRRQPANRNAG